MYNAEYALCLSNHLNVMFYGILFFCQFDLISSLETLYFAYCTAASPSEENECWCLRNSPGISPCHQTAAGGKSRLDNLFSSWWVLIKQDNSDGISWSGGKLFHPTGLQNISFCILIVKISSAAEQQREAIKNNKIS